MAGSLETAASDWQSIA